MTSISLPLFNQTQRDVPSDWHQALIQLQQDLKASSGHWLCFKDQHTTLHTTGPNEINQHHHPYCLAIKSESERLQRCIKTDDHIQHPEALSHDAIWVRRCPFGMVEVIASLTHHDELLGHLLIGSWREQEPDLSLLPTGMKKSFMKLPVFDSLQAWGIINLALNSLRIHLPLRDLQLNQIELSHDPLIQQAIEYMQQELSAGLRAPEVADYLGLSHSRFIHRFNESCGMGFGQWVRRELLNQVVKLLTQSSYPIKEISQQLGFRNPSHLSMLFRQHYDMSPREFREQAKTPRV